MRETRGRSVRLLTVNLTGGYAGGVPGDNVATLTPLTGATRRSFSSNMGGAWAELGGDVTVQVTQHASLYGSGQYARGFDGDRRGDDGEFGAAVELLRWVERCARANVGRRRAGGRSRTVESAVVGRAGSVASKESPHCQVSSSPVSGRGAREAELLGVVGFEEADREAVGVFAADADDLSAVVEPVRGGPRARWCGLLLRGGALEEGFGGEGRSIGSGRGSGLFGARKNLPHCRVGGVFRGLWGGGTSRGGWLRGGSGACRRTGV